MFVTTCAVGLALICDILFKEPRRWHPLVGFGQLASRLEALLNRQQSSRLLGSLAWLLAVLPIAGLGWLLERTLQHQPLILGVTSAVIVYCAVGWQSLLQHAQAVIEPLQAHNLPLARQQVAMIVSRDASQLDEQGIASAATESVLENGADAVFGAVFWFVLLGIPGVVLYRLSNTLDAMWGYRNERYLRFGWAAARIDDLLNYIPARLTAYSYALVGQRQQALEAWRQQGRAWKSPNAGPVMAAGAGAINVRLGGLASYHGAAQMRPVLGLTQGKHASAASITAACRLVNRSLALWLVCLLVSLLMSLGLEALN